jgi:hypothetical protein
MPDKLSLSVGLVSLVVGIILLYNCLFDPTAEIQTARMISGAACLALGLVVVLLVAKRWAGWRRNMWEERHNYIKR